MANTSRLALCAICQETKLEGLIENPTERGKLVLLDALAARRSFEDQKYNILHLDRISVLLNNVDLRWHRSCYSDFTNKSHTMSHE